MTKKRVTRDSSDTCGQIKASTEARAPTPPPGVDVRRATPADAECLATCRTRMFLDMGVPEEATEAVHQAFVAYLKQAIGSCEYLGWVGFLEGRLAGGLGALIQQGPPFSHNMDGRSARLMSMYVLPECRRQGMATALMEAALRDLYRAGIRAFSLVASNQGRPLYLRLGFEDSPEMKLWLPD
jgi:GNAT superfamily N-acetyltransferase